MKILAFDTSGRRGSIALLEGDEPRVVAERVLPDAERTARSLLPAIKTLLDRQAWKPAQIKLICTTSGPGSFTGLRLGVVTAKTFAYATGAQLVGVQTLAAIAAGAPSASPRLWTILDAQRHELFAACFQVEQRLGDDPAPQTRVLSVPNFLAQLRPGDAVAGPPLTKLSSDLPAGVIVVDESHWAPSARAVGRLGVALYRSGHAVDPLALAPNYYRKSAAEEKAMPAN